MMLTTAQKWKWLDLLKNYDPDETDLCELLEEVYQQGRADAIDECIDAIADCISASECDEVLNELKEQK